MPESTLTASEGPMPLTEISFSKIVFSSAVRESEQREGVFADVRVDAQLDFRAGVRQRRERRDRDQHVVADAAGLDDHLIGMFLEQLAAQIGDHLLVHYRSAVTRDANYS